MHLSLTLEASKPSGESYRLGLGCKLPLAWIVTAISWLF